MVATAVCFVCGGGGQDYALMLCENACGIGAHTFCVNMGRAPVGPWYCQICARDNRRVVLAARSRDTRRRARTPEADAAEPERVRTRRRGRTPDEHAAETARRRERRSARSTSESRAAEAERGRSRRRARRMEGRTLVSPTNDDENKQVTVINNFCITIHLFGYFTLTCVLPLQCAVYFTSGTHRNLQK